jgi:predicted nucleotidyltransferase
MHGAQALERIGVDAAAVTALCRRHHIRRLALFGSVLRGDFGPESDIDVLVDFDPDHVPGFLGLYRIESDLSVLFRGRRIDLVTRKALSPRIRDRVLDSAEVLFAA